MIILDELTYLPQILICLDKCPKYLSENTLARKKIEVT